MVAAALFCAGSAWAQPSIQLAPLGTYASGVFNQSAAEISAYDKDSKRLFVVNAQGKRIDVLDLRDPAAPALLFSIDATPYGAVVNSVAVDDGCVAVAVENTVKTEPGKAVFFNTDGEFLSAVTVGALPDMLAFTPNGKYVLVANEGEPSDDYSVDPEGSLSIIKVSAGAKNLTQNHVRTAGFTAFNGATLDPSIRIFGPNATVAQDLEPEYLAISSDSKFAWVTLQENNAIAVVDIKRAKVIELFGLGFKDHSLAGNGLDASDRDGGINIKTWPVKGMYLPDAIARYNVKGAPLLVTANEGDAREYSAFVEELRIGGAVLDAAVFPNAATLKQSANLGRLKITKTRGDTDGDAEFEELYAFGARSFSIWSPRGELIFDSGERLEQITAAAFPANFNASNSNNTFDDRSDDKGPEPEGLALGKIDGRAYAFLGLERIGGVMVFDISDPLAVEFVQYINHRDFTQTPGVNTGGDLGPEGLLFIKADDSPNHKPLLVVTNEVSGTTTIYQIDKIMTKMIAETGATTPVPEQIALFPNYPNPFNPSTRIRYGLPEAAHVTIKVFNLMGVEVATLVEEMREAGHHEVVFNAGDLVSGTYFYRMDINGVVSQMRKLTLIK
jgi:hypothetical protein